MQASDADRRASLAFVGRALRHRNYRLFFAGQSVSLVGTWLTRVATAWLVYRLTGSALLLGLVSFAGQFPVFVLAPFAGVLVDRWNRHRVLVVTQSLALVQSSLLAAFTLSGAITVELLVALSALQGVINGFDMPARQAFVVEMIDDRADLPNAIALNSSMVNGARLLGPSAAGGLIALVGEGGCFVVDAVSYVAVLVSLLRMRLTPREAAPRSARVGAQLREGFVYVAGFAPLRTVLGLLALASLVGMPYTVLLPVVAARRLGGGADLLGFLMAASGLGALTGALWLASRRTVLGLDRFIPLASLTFGLGLMAFSRSTNVWLSLALMYVTGLGLMVQMAASNTIVQTITDEDKRGRVMSYYMMAFVGVAPFGSLLAGWLAERIGAPDTLLVGGALCAVGALRFFFALPRLRAAVRPVYVRLGLLPAPAPVPEILTGVDQASHLRQPPEE